MRTRLPGWQLPRQAPVAYVKDPVRSHRGPDRRQLRTMLQKSWKLTRPDGKVVPYEPEGHEAPPEILEDGEPDTL